MDSSDASAKSSVDVNSWSACYNKEDGIIALSCTVSAGGEGISGVGLILNTDAGSTLAATYVELSGSCPSVSPAINIAPGNLKVGDSVMAVVDGEASGQHFFFQQELTIENC